MGSLLEVDSVGGFAVQATDIVVELVGRTRVGRDQVLAQLLPESPAPRCTLGDFAHVGEDVALVAEYLEGVLRERRRGVAVLLHGAPGTGKTELSRALAAYLGATCPCVPSGSTASPSAAI